MVWLTNSGPDIVKTMLGLVARKLEINEVDEILETGTENQFAALFFKLYLVFALRLLTSPPPPPPTHAHKHNPF